MFELIKKLNVTHIAEHVLMGMVVGAGASVYASVKSGLPVTKTTLIAAAASGAFLGGKNVIDQNKTNAMLALLNPMIPAASIPTSMPVSAPSAATRLTPTP